MELLCEEEVRKYVCGVIEQMIECIHMCECVCGGGE